MKFAFLLFVSAFAFAARAATNRADVVDLMPLPTPVEFASDMDSPVPFDAGTTVVVECGEPAEEWLRTHFAEWFGVDAPKVRAGKTGLALMEGDEAHSLAADASGVRVAARTLAGVRWAAYSLRQLAIAKRGAFKTNGRILPTLKISDRPHLSFRAVHLCWFPEIRPAQMERAIRLAALMKFNYAIVEPWGSYRSARHPWWGWPNGSMTTAEVRRLVALGRDLGITLVPQLNAFGHGAIARSCSLKHAVLDLQPEYEPLFEPGGWNWCLTNPEAQRVMRELIAELHDDFGRPPFFHLGCDEAQPPSCPECRKRPYGETVCGHVSGLVDFVRRRGARAMIWHDMLIDRADPRLKGFVAYGSPSTATLADTLPRDVIVCDWQYGNANGRLDDWPTIAYFSEKGFSVAGCPWKNCKAALPMARFVARRGGFGFVQTTWHALRRAEWRELYVNGAAAAWGTPPQKPAPQYDTAFGNALRFVGHDMKISAPADAGNVNFQIPPTWWIDN